jgi:hypothetical protein
MNMSYRNTRIGAIYTARRSAATAVLGATLLAGLMAPAPAHAALKSSIQNKKFGIPEGGGLVSIIGNLQNDDPTNFVVLTEVHVFDEASNEVFVTGGLLSNLATNTPNPADAITLEPNTPAGNPNSFFPSSAGGELLSFSANDPFTAKLEVSGYTFIGTPPTTPPPSDLLGTFTFQAVAAAPEPSTLGLLALGTGAAATILRPIRRRIASPRR